MKVFKQKIVSLLLEPEIASIVKPGASRSQTNLVLE
jgi:hypothetical protein